MNILEFQKSFLFGDLDTEYMDYLMEHGPENGLMVCNGDMLLDLFERRILFFEFRNSMVKES